MTARNLQQLLADCENEETIQLALDALDELKPATADFANKCAEVRKDLLQELETVRSQGSLF